MSVTASGGGSKVYSAVSEVSGTEYNAGEPTLLEAFRAEEDRMVKRISLHGQGRNLQVDTQMTVSRYGDPDDDPLITDPSGADFNRAGILAHSYNTTQNDSTNGVGFSVSTGNMWDFEFGEAPWDAGQELYWHVNSNGATQSVQCVIQYWDA